MLYLDASALVKLVLPEPESVALSELVAPDSDVVSSVIARVEVSQAVRRVALEEAGLERMAVMLERLDVRALDDAVAVAAHDLPPRLRSLDAIHLATAITLREELEAFVVYDHRLADAAAEAGLSVASPGV